MSRKQNRISSSFFRKSRDQNVGVILVTTDRGLCGGLNANLFRLALRAFENGKKQGVNIKLVLIGNKGINFFTKIGGVGNWESSQLGDTPSSDDLIGSVKIMIDSFVSNELIKFIILDTITSLIA